MSRSLVERVVRRLGPERTLAAMDAEQQAVLPYVWELMARPEQLAPPGDWRWWAAIAGRGWGKTKCGAEWVRMKARTMPRSIGAIIGQTPDEVRKIQIEGPAGILACSLPGERPKWEPSKDTLTWPNGTVATVYSGANPSDFRGPQFHWAWGDELAKWSRARESFDNLNFGLRLEYRGGIQPQACITTTPRPITVIKELVQKANARVVRGSTYDNKNYLARSFIEEVLGAYEGTKIGRQELFGEILDDVPGALWSRSMFELAGFRVEHLATDDELIAVAMDPSASNTEGSDETGIIVAARRMVKDLAHFHVLADRTVSASARDRARTAIDAFVEFKADRFVVETNNGGDWIPATIENEWMAMGLPGAAPIECVTASRGKRTRAEPVSMLYEQRRVTHAPGLVDLEDQLCTWSPFLIEGSPDRLDALVWALSWLSTAPFTVLA